ncbi:tetratricopeptide repeat protein [Marinobacterium arenosum]|uniref:tetratricopeptide repeat protein n=1 Tax=Marinobacterium arenosum TaxID=2862496 RepID=UPI001C961097|nr:tetratricopeptide repeat protein [Marinobacterium arenosum]
MRSTIVYMLRSLGVQNIKAITINSRVFVEIAESRYDVILLGHNNRESVGGIQILEEARFRGVMRPSVAWLFMTGDASQELILHAIDSKPDAVVTKPFSVDELKRRLDGVLRRKAMFHQIEEAIEREDWEEALLRCERDFSPTMDTYGQAQVIKAEMLARLNQHQEALQVLEEAYWRRQDKEVAFAWARLALEMERYEVARDLLLDLIQRHPLLIAAYDLLAEVHECLGDTEAALEALQEATARAPMGIPRQMRLGRTATQTGRYDLASGAYQKSIILGRHSCYRSPEPYLRLANIRRLELNGATGRQRDSLAGGIEQLLVNAQSKFPRDRELEVRAALLRAEMYKELGDSLNTKKFQEAAQMYNQELEQPLDLERERLDVTGDKVPVLEPVAQPIEPSPESAPQGQPGQDPMMSQKVNRQGVKQYLAGKLVQAIKHFTLAIDYDRNNAYALLNLAQLFLETARDSQQNRDERLKMADRYLKLTKLLDLDDSAGQKAELLAELLAAGVEQLPDGSLGALLR